MGVLNICCLFVCHSTVVIILDLEVIKPADQMAGKIGDPTPYVEGEFTLNWESRKVVWLLGLCYRLINTTSVHSVVDK